MRARTRMAGNDSIAENRTGCSVVEITDAGRFKVDNADEFLRNCQDGKRKKVLCGALSTNPLILSTISRKRPRFNTTRPDALFSLVGGILGFTSLR